MDELRVLTGRRKKKASSELFNVNIAGLSANGSRREIVGYFGEMCRVLGVKLFPHSVEQKIIQEALFVLVCPGCSAVGAASPERSASFLKHRSGALNWAPQAPVAQVRLWQNNNPKNNCLFWLYSLLVRIYPVLAATDDSYLNA